MNDAEFMEFMNALKIYLDSPKTFMQNPKQIAKVNAATEIAHKLFPEAAIHIGDDPLQCGALILYIEDFDITVREMPLFNTLVQHASNFEIYSKEQDQVTLAILFSDVFIRIKNP